MTNRGMPAARMLLCMIISIILVSVIVSAGSVTIYLEDLVKSEFGSDGKCGRSSSQNGWIDQCNTIAFIGTGPGGCAKSSVVDSGIGGCYFWQPDGNPRVDATTKIKINDAPKGASGKLTVGTANFGGGTYLREQVEVYVNGKFVGTTKDPLCNVPNCENAGPVLSEFKNISLKSGVNDIRFRSVANGGSVWVGGYQVDYTPNVCTPGDVETKPCGNCGYKERTCNADGQWGKYSECKDQGVCAPGQVESQSCGTDEGVCTVGSESRTCSSACEWSDFSQCSGIPPSNETCDDLDNDCDGQVDEGTTKTCIDYNTCQRVQLCTDECPAAPAEVCDQKDNDCDGQVDEGDVCGPTCGDGVCTGTEQCEWDGASRQQKLCDGSPIPEGYECAGCMLYELCGNGRLDPGEECEIGQTDTDTCGTDVGACTLGEQTRSCSSSCEWNDFSQCTGIPPSDEICDQIDNNCDGTVDEGCTPQAVCGNGILEEGEQCDDGNTQDGDGCSSTCEVEYECNEDSDCDDLDRQYCNESTITTVEGVCREHVCTVEETPIEDCSERNGVTGQCGILGWSCSEELNEVVCVITEVTPDDSYCENYCDGDSLYQGVCDPHTYLCDYDVTDCTDLNERYCDGTSYIKERYTCDDAACRLKGTIKVNCDNGLFCDGSETCQDGYCKQGTQVDCSINNITGISTCTNVPDANNYTFDYRASFTSVCNEATDSCTSGDPSIEHICSEDVCNAQCDDDYDCGPTECDQLDACHGTDYYDYSDKQNSCTSSCGCEMNACSNPTITHNDPRCHVQTCGDGVVEGSEQCEGNQTQTIACGTDEGVCTVGNKTRSCNAATCEWNNYGQCSGIPPSNETCDYVDNDCDGQTDENVTRTCIDYNTCGVVHICASSCPTAPQEVCNQVDDDCDGQVDEGNVCEAVCGDGVVEGSEECEIGDYESISCGTDEGVCTIGNKMRSCTNDCEWGNYSQCSGIPPSNETCDYLDNDCDGSTDENLTRTCTDYNTCQPIQTCASSCPTAPAEVCNQVDDDCDGYVDEGNVCGPVCGNGIVEPGEECEIGDVSARTCGTDTGACTVGSQTRSCNAWCEWNDYGVCSGIPPSNETCDYVDNDCDGSTDENLTRTCTDYNTCQPIQTCASSCQSAPQEVCNQIDDDCDGQIDEGQVCGQVCGDGVVEGSEQCEGNQTQTISCGTDEGICTVGNKTRNCNAATCEWNNYGQCSGIPPSNETCDYVDNDCDGSTDENLTRTCTDYNTCQLIQTCASSCPTAPVEVCDSIDNDCDGYVDEGNVCGPVCGNGIVEEGEQCDGNSETISCGTDEGVCTIGNKTRSCSTSCEWNEYGVCSGTQPQSEVCDELDNDCDGVIDEGFVCQPPGVCENDVEILDDYSIRGSGGTIDYIGSYDELRTDYVDFSAVVNDVNSPADARGYVTLSIRGFTSENQRVSLRVKGNPTEIVKNVCDSFEVENVWWSQNTLDIQGQPPQTVTFDEIGYEWDRDTDIVNIYGIGPQVDFKVDNINAICLNCE